MRRKRLFLNSRQNFHACRSEFSQFQHRLTRRRNSDEILSLSLNYEEGIGEKKVRYKYHNFHACRSEFSWVETRRVTRRQNRYTKNRKKRRRGFSKQRISLRPLRAWGPPSWASVATPRRGKPFSCLSSGHHRARMRGRPDESIYSTSGRCRGTDATPTLSRARYVDTWFSGNDISSLSRTRCQLPAESSSTLSKITDTWSIPACLLRCIHVGSRRIFQSILWMIG